MNAMRKMQIPVRGELDVASVIAGTQHFCASNGLPHLFGAHIATAASELANNLWIHTRRGGLIGLVLLDAGPRVGVELVAVDDGPGIDDVGQAMTEGYSSSGGLGCGLPGVRRLMDEFELETRLGHGTRVIARKWLQARP